MNALPHNYVRPCTDS